MDGGDVVATGNHRRVIEVDADVTSETPDVKALFAHFATPARIAAKKAKKPPGQP
jgi:hypothetical protein